MLAVLLSGHFSNNVGRHKLIMFYMEDTPYNRTSWQTDLCVKAPNALKA